MLANIPINSALTFGKDILEASFAVTMTLPPRWPVVTLRSTYIRKLFDGTWSEHTLSLIIVRKHYYRGWRIWILDKCLISPHGTRGHFIAAVSHQHHFHRPINCLPLAWQYIVFPSEHHIFHEIDSMVDHMIDNTNINNDVASSYSPHFNLLRFFYSSIMKRRLCMNRYIRTLEFCAQVASIVFR